MKLITLFLFAVVAASCTYSINKVSTEGNASDVIDEVQEASPDVSPNIELPLVNGSGYPEDFICTPPPGMNGPMQPIS